MAPSTIFFHWRRDNRRSRASLAPSSQPALKDARSASKTSVADSPPRLPVIPSTPALATTIVGSPVTADVQETQLSRETSPGLDATKLSVSELSRNDLSPSSASLALPPTSSKSPSPSKSPSSSKSQSGLHSSPEERAKDPVLTSDHSRLAITTPHHDNGDRDAYNSVSGLRPLFGKGLLNTQTQAADVHKSSSTPGTSSAGHSRLLPSPLNDSLGDKPAMMQKDYRSEIPHSRRYADRDVSPENSHHRPGKAMLHLLNPVSLLAKRRSSQLAGSWGEDTNIGVQSVVPAIPDDYDPRIRGSIVHDFSAPRPRRNLSVTPCLPRDEATQPNVHLVIPDEHGAPPNFYDPSSQSAGQKKRHSGYSPVFKEHFDDDEKSLQVENKAYLQSPLLVNSNNHDCEGSVPAFAKRLPSKLPDGSENSTNHDANGYKASPDQWNGDLPESQGQDADVVEKVPELSSDFPKHLKSNASRFSFDMNAVESSAQEKYLEDKHKEKEAVRRANFQFEDREFCDVDDDYDDFMDDAYDFEEKIPGVNVDSDDDVDGSVPGPAPLFSPVIVTPSNVVGSNLATYSASSGVCAQPTNVEITETPTKDQSYLHLYDTPTTKDEINTQSGNATETRSAVTAVQTLGATKPNAPQPFDDDDDLYFDDGGFGDLGDDIGREKFDESIFDDETSHLYDRNSLSKRLPPRLEESSGSNASREDDDSMGRPAGGLEVKHVPSMASELQAVSSINYEAPGRIPNTGPIKSHGGVLTEHNLEALHNALAKAANDAARAPSVSECSAGQESVSLTADSHPGLVSDDSHLSQFMDTLVADEAFEDFRYDDDDEALYDDPIIAAANAEALENDEEGFYGEEFGFYAQARGSCSSQLTNGGYFGPRGVEGIARSGTTRGKFREPSLTPITERSERSTRNSVISLPAHGTALSNPTMSNPPLAQLVDIDNIDDEMTLSVLMKLRRGAFGGSNGSLRSTSTSPPLCPRPLSNRGSFTGLSDASPTVLDFKIPSEWPTGDPDKERLPTGSYASYASYAEDGLPRAGSANEIL